MSERRPTMREFKELRDEVGAWRRCTEMISAELRAQAIRAESYRDTLLAEARGRTRPQRTAEQRPRHLRLIRGDGRGCRPPGPRPVLRIVRCAS